MEKSFMQAMQERYSCKLFDPEKPLVQEEINYLLEIGRLSPSSIGLEQWKFVVVQSEKKRQALRKASWDQPQITTAGLVVVLLGRLAELHPEHPHIANRLHALVEGNEEAFKGTLGFYTRFYEERKDSLPRWSSEQCHIAAANMMTGAAVRGIDSCPIGGFVEEDVKKVLGVGEDEMVSLILAFGHSAKPGRPKDRLPLDQLVTYI